MCGICGTWNSHGASLPALRQMADQIRHRGPDDDGYYVNAEVGLANLRLSIIDLDTGKQPISNEDETLWIVFNGEIYNFPALRRSLLEKGHQFKTQTDTEVILHLYEEYGLDCVKELRGMFAFALWDIPAQRLFLARDPLGQKPLYYSFQGGNLAFASEIKALLAGLDAQPSLNARAMHNYISLRYIPDEDTLFEGINKLPAAHTLTLQDGRLEIRPYWSLDYTQKFTASEDELADGLHDLLLDTVKGHMLSDVPLGAFLSGGLDSSLIVGMMSRLSDQPIQTFSIGVREQDFNELPYARMVAERYKTRHHEWIVDPDVVVNLPEMIWHMDEPVDPFAFGVYSVSQLAAQHVKVVLGGDGGDEMFAGYDRYLGNQFVDFYCMVPPVLRRSLIEPIILGLPDNFSYNNRVQKLRWMVAMSKSSAGERYARSASFLRFSHEQKQALYTPELWSRLSDTNSLDHLVRLFNAGNARHPIDKMLYTDVKTRLADHLLMITDRMTMAHSIEGRSPLVDQKVVEYVARMPGGLKLRGRQLKYIQRRIAKDYLPEPLLRRSKQGFGFPLAYWFRGELRELTGMLFRESNLVAEGFFQPEALTGLLDEHASGKVDHNYRLWLLFNLELWHRLFIRNEPKDALQDMLRTSLDRARHKAGAPALNGAAPVASITS